MGCNEACGAPGQNLVAVLMRVATRRIRTLPRASRHCTTALEHLSAEREENVRLLEELLPHFNTFNLLAWLSLRNLSIDPDDIAMGVVYLASDEAKFVTGAELVIDGWYTPR